MGSALRQVNEALLPNMNVQEALATFDRAEAEALAVIKRLHRVG